MILEQLGADREKCHISHDGHTFKLNYLTSAIVTINLLNFKSTTQSAISVSGRGWHAYVGWCLQSILSGTPRTPAEKPGCYHGWWYPPEAKDLTQILLTFPQYPGMEPSMYGPRLQALCLLFHRHSFRFQWGGQCWLFHFQGGHCVLTFAWMCQSPPYFSSRTTCSTPSLVWVESTSY